MSIQTVFQFGGGREFVNEERAKALLEAISITSTSTQFKIGNKSYDNAAAQTIADYLNSVECNVEVAEIDDIIAGRPEDEALRTLAIICSGLKRFDLIELNLSDNAMGAKGVESCKDLLCKKFLQRLYMCNDGLSAEAMVLIASILSEGGCPPLRVLHFYNNMSGSDGAKAALEIVKQCPLLENFRYSGTRPGAAGCIAIAEAIHSVTKLKRIDVADDNFGKAASLKLAEALIKQPELEYLNLRDNAFSSDGFLFLFESIQSLAFPNLAFLDISGNEITEETVQKLSACFPVLSKLESLLMDDNEFGSDGCLLLAAAISSSTPSSPDAGGLISFKFLSVCCCEITGKGAVTLARALTKLSTFQKLEMNGNELSERAIDMLKRDFNAVGKVLGELDENDDGAEDDLESLVDEGGESDGDEDLIEGLKNTKI
eukprot:gene24484-32935_t